MMAQELPFAAAIFACGAQMSLFNSKILFYVPVEKAVPISWREEFDESHQLLATIMS